MHTHVHIHILTDLHRLNLALQPLWMNYELPTPPRSCWRKNSFLKVATIWNSKRPKLCGHIGLAGTLIMYGQPSHTNSVILNSFLCKLRIKHTLHEVVMKTSWDDVRGACLAQWLAHGGCAEIRIGHPHRPDIFNRTANFPRRNGVERGDGKIWFQFIWKFNPEDKAACYSPEVWFFTLFQNNCLLLFAREKNQTFYWTVSCML